MANRWEIQDSISKSDKHAWEFPSPKDQHITDTVAPGDLNLRPSDVDLTPTNAPKRSGIQHGQWDWDYTNVPDSTWYSIYD